MPLLSSLDAVDRALLAVAVGAGAVATALLLSRRTDHENTPGLTAAASAAVLPSQQPSNKSVPPDYGTITQAVETAGLRDDGMRVQTIYIHPVKSCGGTRVAAAEVTASGLKWDREWFVCRAVNGEYTDGANVPPLAGIYCRVDEQRAQLVMCSFRSSPFANPPPLFVPLDPPPASRTAAGAATREVTLNGIACKAVDEGDAAAAFLAAATAGAHGPLRLMRIVSDRNAATKPRGFGPLAVPSDNLRGQSFGAVNVLTAESIAALEAAVRAHPANASSQDSPEWSLREEQFRANVIVAGAPRAYDEDTWIRFTLGGAALRHARMTARCRIITLHGDGSGTQRDLEPIRTLRRVRMTRHAHVAHDAAAPLQAMFGTDCFLEGCTPGTTIRVGDAVAVSGRRALPHFEPPADR